MSDEAKPPVFTQHMTMHMNGGSKFSELHYSVRVDGRETKITRHKRTNGSPKYLITDDFFKCGDELFDVMETRGVGMMDWLMAHAGLEDADE